MTDTPSPSLTGVRVLIVEDETLVSMLLEDMIADLGCEVVAAAARVSQALELVADAELDIDVAILDVNVAGESISPVAQAMADRGQRFVFATGYGESGVPEAWRGRPALQKPYSSNDVERVLKAALGR